MEVFLFSNHTTTSPAVTPFSLSPTPPSYPVSSPQSCIPSRRRRAPHVRTSYPQPTPPGHSERPRTAPSIRNRQISSEGRQRPQAARAQDIGEAEARVNSAPVNSYTSQRYTRNEYMHD